VYSPSPLLPFLGTQVDLLFLCSRFFHLPVTGRHRWEAGSTDRLQHPTRRAIWPWMWCSVNILCCYNRN